MLAPLNFHKWQTHEFALAGLTIRIDELAARHGLPVCAWEEDGLGTVQGLACRLPSGRVFVLEEMQLAKVEGMPGPYVLVDGADLASLGIEALVAEILEELQLSRSNLAFICNEETHQRAVEVAARLRRDYPSGGD